MDVFGPVDVVVQDVEVVRIASSSHSQLDFVLESTGDTLQLRTTTDEDNIVQVNSLDAGILYLLLYVGDNLARASYDIVRSVGRVDSINSCLVGY